MSSEKRKWAFRIRHMLEAIEECQCFVEGMTYEQFCTDARSMKAVVWNISTIGEAAGRLPDPVRQAFPSIPWADIRGMRNHIVHGFDQIDPEIVWLGVQEELPALAPELEQILKEAKD